MLRLPLSEQDVSNLLGRKKEKKKELEKLLGINIKVEDSSLIATSDKYTDYELSQVFDAIILGFKPRVATLLVNPLYVFKRVDVKALVRPSRLTHIMARLIGTGGKTIKKIEETSDCYVTIHNHYIGLIGKSENVNIATEAINLIIQGKSFSTVYRSIEQARRKLHYSKSKFE